MKLHFKLAVYINAANLNVISFSIVKPSGECTYLGKVGPNPSTTVQKFKGTTPHCFRTTSWKIKKRTSHTNDKIEGFFELSSSDYLKK